MPPRVLMHSFGGTAPYLDGLAGEVLTTQPPDYIPYKTPIYPLYTSFKPPTYPLYTPFTPPLYPLYPLRPGEDEAVGPALLLRLLGGAVQVDPIKLKLKPPGTERLRLKCDILLSSSAFKSDLRRYISAVVNLRSPKTADVIRAVPADRLLLER